MFSFETDYRLTGSELKYGTPDVMRDLYVKIIMWLSAAKIHNWVDMRCARAY